MQPWFRLVGPNQAVELLGVKLVGVTAENGRKLLFTIAFLVAVRLIAAVAYRVSHALLQRDTRAEFWTRQFIRIVAAIVTVVGTVSIWFDDPGRAAAALGLITAGLAFALQRVVTALAGYLVILRGGTFNVGDRIKMGGVRGDVIGIGFLQTTIMEMGQPPSAQAEDPGMWVQARQYSGRIVTVTNAKIFDEPVYNYTRDFPYIFEEIRLPIPYSADRERVERILLDAAERHGVTADSLAPHVLAELQRRYFMETPDVRARVFLRLTDNWLEFALRFLTHEHGIREVKDAMGRQILAALQEARIGLASTTVEIVGVPPLRVTPPGGEALDHATGS